LSARARELVASINGRAVGVLRERANLWSFEYELDWIDADNGYDLAPSLPRKLRSVHDGATERPVQWFFDNLLPEEQARDALSREAKIESADSFGLLSYYGRESAGAITLMPPGEGQPKPDYLPLSDAELHKRIRNRAKQPLAASAPKKMSNAGAQDKLAVVVRDGKLFHPVGSAPSTHLLKPDLIDRENWPNTVANEYFVMRLAAELGVSVPRVDIRFVPDPIYLIERFDRTTTEQGVQRLHIVDACQLLGVDRTFKYQNADVQTLTTCLSLCNNPAQSRQQILAWTLFNLLVGNADAHLKNISFHVGPHGITIAPFYDLVSTESYRAGAESDPRWPNRELTMRIGDVGTFAAVDRNAFEQFAGALGVTRRAADRLMSDFAERIEIAASALYKEFEQLTIPDEMRAGQLMTLRTIRKIIIQEMAAKFRLGKPMKKGR
jgi:serine/threonine-protein kinase HipA